MQVVLAKQGVRVRSDSGRAGLRAQAGHIVSSAARDRWGCSETCCTQAQAKQHLPLLRSDDWSLSRQCCADSTVLTTGP